MTAYHRVKDKKVWWLAVGAVLVVVILIGVGLYYLYKGKTVEPVNEKNLPAPLVREDAISLSLFFASASTDSLVQEDRLIAKKGVLVDQVKEALNELLKGSSTGNAPVLSAKAKVREVFIDAEGVAFVDFSREVAEDFPGGSWTELAAVYAVVNTLAYNFPEIRKVQLLVEGVQIPTLAGHVDIMRPIPPRMGLVQSVKGQATP
ncbi:MAG: GerMN domain-containing protein [Nitrospirota bacterium]|nr:GerMN domain-containing protein [Nitrospirota bacterium]